MGLVTRMFVVGCAVAVIAGCGSSGGGSSATQAAQTPSTATTAPTATTTTTAAQTTTDTAAKENVKASPDSTDRPDTNGDGSPDTQTFRGHTGDQFTLVGQPGYKKPSRVAAKVKVLGLGGPYTGFDLDPGRQLIGVKVHFEGVGTKVFDDPQPSGQLTVTGGETGKPTSLITGSGKAPCDNPSLKLHKGQKAEVCIAYDIPKNAKPKVFEYGASSGYGDTGIWKFG